MRYGQVDDEVELSHMLIRLEHVEAFESDESETKYGRQARPGRYERDEAAQINVEAVAHVETGKFAQYEQRRHDRAHDQVDDGEADDAEKFRLPQRPMLVNVEQEDGIEQSAKQEVNAQNDGEYECDNVVGLRQDVFFHFYFVILISY